MGRESITNCEQGLFARSRNSLESFIVNRREAAEFIRFPLAPVHNDRTTCAPLTSCPNAPTSSPFSSSRRPYRHRAGCEFDYSGTQACKALKEEATRDFGELQSGDDHDRS